MERDKEKLKEIMDNALFIAIEPLEEPEVEALIDREIEPDYLNPFRVRVMGRNPALGTCLGMYAHPNITVKSSDPNDWNDIFAGVYDERPFYNPLIITTERDERGEYFGGIGCYWKPLKDQDPKLIAEDLDAHNQNVNLGIREIGHARIPANRKSKGVNRFVGKQEGPAIRINPYYCIREYAEDGERGEVAGLEGNGSLEDLGKEIAHEYGRSFREYLTFRSTPCNVGLETKGYRFIELSGEERNTLERTISDKIDYFGEYYTSCGPLMSLRWCENTGVNPGRPTLEEVKEYRRMVRLEK